MRKNIYKNIHLIDIHSPINLSKPLPTHSATEELHQSCDILSVGQKRCLPEAGTMNM